VRLAVTSFQADCGNFCRNLSEQRRVGFIETGSGRETSLVKKLEKEIWMPQNQGRGFASMDEDRQRAIAAKGGHESGGNFRNDPQRAAAAGHKGGQVSGGNFKFNRERAAEAGRKGGLR
jgi:general stress protein YciG